MDVMGLEREREARKERKRMKKALEEKRERKARREQEHEREREREESRRDPKTCKQTVSKAEHVARKLGVVENARQRNEVGRKHPARLAVSGKVDALGL